MRRPILSPASHLIPPDVSRRKLLLTGCCLLTSSVLPNRLSLADESESHADRSPRTIEAWEGDRQVVIAYQQGPSKGEPCRQLEFAEPQLPVKLQWQLPPQWATRFPAIHFFKSNGEWELIEGWEGADAFVEIYSDFNPSQRSPRQISPFKQFVQAYYPPYWSWPGGITNHLLDPHGPHRFSEFELRGLKTSEKKRLHAAHHQGLIEPGRRPPSPEEIAAGLEPVEEGIDLGH